MTLLSSLDLELNAGGRDGRLELELPAIEVTPSLGLDPNHDGQLTPTETRHRTTAMNLWMGHAFLLIADGSPCRIGPVTAELTQSSLLALHATFDCGKIIRALEVRSGLDEMIGSGSSTFVQLSRHGGAPDRTLLAGRAASHTFTLGTSESSWLTALEFVTLGIHHIFTGYDHILFLLALLMLGGGFVRVIGLASAFTVAHTITLCLAATHTVVLPTRITESAIAASIAYVAAEKWAGASPPAFGSPEPLGLRLRWLLTFGFGLIHGFASALAERGLPPQHLPIALGSFNLGVELGQITIITIAYPLLRQAASHPWYRPRGVRGASVGVFAVAAYWFVQRAFT